MFSCNAGFQVFGLGPWFSLFWNERDSESYVALRSYIVFCEDA